MRAFIKHIFFNKRVLLLVLALLTPLCAYSQHNKYYFQLLGGDAELSRTAGESWLVLSKDRVFELKPGDIIALKRGGRGELRFPDGTTARLKNQAAVSLHRYAISLKKGYAWLVVKRSADVFKVFTPLGSLSVLGTSFDVNVDNFGKAAVRVFEGIVAVRAEADTRKRQLVLQRGMASRLDDKNRVADKPAKFGSAAELSAITAEWGQRKAEEFKNTVGALTNWQKQKGLPPIKDEIKTTPQKQAEPYYKPPVNVQIMARQRDEFSEMLKKQQLKRNSVIGTRLSDEGVKKLKDEGYGAGFGESPFESHAGADLSLIKSQEDNLNNKLLRLQSQIRQTELQIAALINKSSPSASDKIRTASLQSRLIGLQREHRIITNMLKEAQSKKLAR